MEGGTWRRMTGGDGGARCVPAHDRMLSNRESIMTASAVDSPHKEFVGFHLDPGVMSV
jgi:hypothetical protein